MPLRRCVGSLTGVFTARPEGFSLRKATAAASGACKAHRSRPTNIWERIGVSAVAPPHVRPVKSCACARSSQLNEASVVASGGGFCLAIIPHLTGQKHGVI
jgi:hypothetical protein